jgi:hypothetical protein
MESKAFIEKYLIKEVESLLESKRYYPLLVYGSIGIETLGAIIDTKPIRAREQSRFRFASALFHLFPNQYGFVNKQNFLYETLRNHSAHNLLPSSKILIVNQDNKTVRHLDQKKDQLTFVVDIFARDFLKACKTAIEMIDKGEVKSKHIQI